MTLPGPATADMATGPFRVGEVPALEGLRAASILLVMLSHSYLHNIVPGALGVTLFFFISGFIITVLLYRELERQDRIDIASFYARRALRLYPALLVLILAVAATRYIEGAPPASLAMAGSLFYFVNYLDIWVPERMIHQLGHLWSLAVEMHFYLLYPFLFVWLARTPGRFMSALALLALAVLIGRVAAWNWLAPSQTAVAISYTSMASEMRIDSIAFGAMAATLAMRGRPDAVVARLTARPVLLVALAALLLSVLYRDQDFRQTLRFSLQSLAFVPLVLAAVLAPALKGVRRFLASTPLATIGVLSYALYLWHPLAFDIMEKALAPHGLPAGVAAGWVATFAAAALSYRYVEVPILALRHRFGSEHRPRLTGAPSDSSAVASALSVRSHPSR